MESDPDNFGDFFDIVFGDSHLYESVLTSPGISQFRVIFLRGFSLSHQPFALANHVLGFEYGFFGENGDIVFSSFESSSSLARSLFLEKLR